jgi:hypothetical protein
MVTPEKKPTKKKDKGKGKKKVRQEEVQEGTEENEAEDEPDPNGFLKDNCCMFFLFCGCMFLLTFYLKIGTTSWILPNLTARKYIMKEDTTEKGSVLYPQQVHPYVYRGLVACYAPGKLLTPTSTQQSTQGTHKKKFCPGCPRASPNSIRPIVKKIFSFCLLLLHIICKSNHIVLLHSVEAILI